MNTHTTWVLGFFLFLSSLFGTVQGQTYCGFRIGAGGTAWMIQPHAIQNFRSFLADNSNLNLVSDGYYTTSGRPSIQLGFIVQKNFTSSLFSRIELFYGQDGTAFSETFHIDNYTYKLRGDLLGHRFYLPFLIGYEYSWRRYGLFVLGGPYLSYASQYSLNQNLQGRNYYKENTQEYRSGFDFKQTELGMQFGLGFRVIYPKGSWFIESRIQGGFTDLQVGAWGNGSVRNIGQFLSTGYLFLIP